jgi:putative oxidoreductase
VRTESPGGSSATATVLLLLRVVAGLIMAYHGLGKFQGGVSNFAGFIGSLGLPAPLLLAWVTSVLELAGGLAVAVGLLARPVAALLALEMLITGVYVKLIKGGVGILAPPDQPGAGAEVDFLYLVAFLVVVVLGPGAYSVDAALGRERVGTEAAPARGAPA